MYTNQVCTLGDVKNMNPKRFGQEIDYYDRIIDKYQEHLDGKLVNGNMIQFSAQEMIVLMEELKDCRDDTSCDENEMMELIAKNTLVLLLSLFEKKDETTDFKTYSELTENEKQLLKTNISPMLV
jgi:hypothetical protein